MFSDPNPNSLPEIQLDNFLSPTNRWMKLFGIVLLSTLGGLSVLPSLFKYDVVVKVEAVVRPLGEVKAVQASVEGAITQIYVKENQIIKQGEPIATINDSRLKTQVIQHQESIRKTEQQRTRIDAQIAALNRQIAAETDQIKQSVASAEAQLQLSQRNYRDQQLKTQADVLQAQASLELAQEELNRFQQLANTGAISLLQLREKESTFKVAMAQLASARALLNPSAALVKIANKGIAQRQSEGQAVIANLVKDREVLVQQGIQLENQISFDYQQIAQLQRDLKSTIVRAPVDGTILQLNVRSTSQVVEAKDVIAQVMPSSVPLVIKAYASSQDVSQIKIGQRVQMRLSACPYPDFGTLKGKVNAVSPDTVTLIQGQTANKAAYEVTIVPERLMLTQGTRQCLTQAGMEGRADIITRDETVLQFLLRKARLLTDV
ncbi:HlyD family secretion protein [Nostoc sp. T09]|uniref:HlyD family secretion protein n=1 Tax=Nostoc sp. T09 TaxID=1932621 RepID=UPI000A389A94|nr:HlyD family efflux transporter periplasmic adaptor subunit [Nostoc sp. T09]OUL37137.1 HlyD family secretion protein [Nostoc sp. T09]